MKITRIMLSAVALAAACNFMYARDTRAEVHANPLRAAGVYYAYPVDEISPDYGSPAPEGYTPFYVSHYGRHGSRYLISDKDYSRVMEKLARAHEAGALSPRGELLRAQMDTIWEEARGRGGELSPLGNRQHRGIARRLGTAYPEIFADGADMYASSTVIMRCAHSMFAFIEGLKELYPGLEIPRESGERDMVFLNYHSPESGFYSSHEGPYYQDYRRFYDKNTQPGRLMGELFTDSAYVGRWVDQKALMWDLYWLAADMQNMETDIDLMDLFTEDELYGLWQTANFGFFGRNSSYKPAEGQFTRNAQNLLNNIIDNADSYIAENRHGATLRFGHDGNIIPLTALMKLVGCHSDIERPEDLASEYADFHVSPMASNLQMIFFRNPAKAGTEDEILVRIYLNEKDAPLPVEPVSLPGTKGIYYRWSDLRPYLATQAGR